MIKTSPFPLTTLQDMSRLFGPRVSAVAAEPFDVGEIQKRVLQKSKSGKGKPAFYIDARTLDERLNLMFGYNWSVGFNVIPTDTNMVASCVLSIVGIAREDISEEPMKQMKKDYKNDGKFVMSGNELAAQKAQAGAYKRAAVKFGIGAYLYDFKDEIIWEELDPKYSGAFKNPKIKLSDLPPFALPKPGPTIVMNELKYLCGTDDTEILQDTLLTYWGLDSIKDLDRATSFRLAACIARVSDYLELTGLQLEDLLLQRQRFTKELMETQESTVGFKSE